VAEVEVVEVRAWEVAPTVSAADPTSHSRVARLLRLQPQYRPDIQSHKPSLRDGH